MSANRHRIAPWNQKAIEMDIDGRITRRKSLSGAFPNPAKRCRCLCRDIAGRGKAAQGFMRHLIEKMTLMGSHMVTRLITRCTASGLIETTVSARKQRSIPLRTIRDLMAGALAYLPALSETCYTSRAPQRVPWHFAPPASASPAPPPVPLPSSPRS